MDDEVDYGLFLEALSGAVPIQARRFAAAKALEIGWDGYQKSLLLLDFREIQSIRASKSLRVMMN